MIRSTLYKTIRDRALQLDGIREVHLYRGREANESQEEAFPHRPCLLIEFGDAVWDETQQRARNTRTVEITVHLIQDLVNSSDEDLIRRFDLLEDVATWLHGIGVDGNDLYKTTPLLHSRDRLDPEPNRISHDRVSFTTSFKEQDSYYLKRTKTKANLNTSTSY